MLSEVPVAATTPAVTSPEPSPTDSVDPVSASAEQFVRDYFDEFNRAQASGDYRRLHSMYLPSCEVCVGDVKIGEDSVARGEILEGSEFEILDLEVLPPDATSLRGVTIKLRNKPARLLTASGELIKAYPQTAVSKMIIDLHRDSDSGWSIFLMTTIEIIR